MKQILSAVFLALFLFPACRKNSVDTNGISGSWKLVEVYDKNTATTMLPPTATNMDVVITFLDRSRFAGHTLRNSLTDGDYLHNGNEITFKTFSMTKIAEDQWGGSFLTVLTACSLQSVVPCSPSIIEIDGDVMSIRTPLRYDVVLRRM